MASIPSGIPQGNNEVNASSQSAPGSPKLETAKNQSYIQTETADTGAKIYHEINQHQKQQHFHHQQSGLYSQNSNDDTNDERYVN